MRRKAVLGIFRQRLILKVAKTERVLLLRVEGSQDIQPVVKVHLGTHRVLRCVLPSDIHAALSRAGRVGCARRCATNSCRAFLS